MSETIIREATEKDFRLIWPIFSAVVSSGDTYAYDSGLNFDQAKKVWLEDPLKCLIVEKDREVLGTYYIKSNQGGGGRHVCNCGYMVAAKARGMGLATEMCVHSQALALEFGFKAMQFNFVVSSNDSAVALWQKLGFDIVGTLPKAFLHPDGRYVDAYVMHKILV
ncbi:MAG: GNAT family N-acetyltransferase [Pseudomonadota bacterium]